MTARHPLEGATMWEVGVEGDYFNPHKFHQGDDDTDCVRAGCVPMADLTKRTRISEMDRDHVFEVIGREDAKWFGAQLLRLIHIADLPNRQYLAQAFPDYVRAYEVALRREGGLDDNTILCRHCGEAIAKDPAQTLGLDVWYHTTGDGGRVYCAYTPDSTKAEPK